jgi:hypothetical protein
MALVHTTDHLAQALNRLAQQYRDKPDIVAWLTVLCSQVQDLEDVFWTLQPQNDTGIATATGYLLDVIGRIVGEPRGSSADDAEYRLRLLARVRSNFSSGSTESVYAVFRALLGSSPSLAVSSGWPAAFTLLLGDYSVDPADVELFADFLRSARAAGDYAILEFIQGLEANTFRLPQSTTITGPILAGVTSVPVVSTNGFPASGSLLLDQGVAGLEETVTFSFKTALSFTTSATAHSHGSRSSVCLVGTTGLGFSDSTSPTVGGELAGAVGT